MIKKWASLDKGFTIVELLIVVIVLGILAAISIVAYSGIQKRAHNSNSASSMNQWVKAFELYRANGNGAYPAVTSSVAGTGYCLGSGFPDNSGQAACRKYRFVIADQTYNESASAALMAEMKAKDASAPFNTRLPEVEGEVGPYMIAFDTNSSTATTEIYQITSPFYASNDTELDKVCNNAGLVRASSVTNGYGLCKKDLLP